MIRFLHHQSQGSRPARWLIWPAQIARTAIGALAARHRRAVACRDLQSLDAYMLRDLGLSHRAAAEFPCHRLTRLL